MSITKLNNNSIIVDDRFEEHEDCKLLRNSFNRKAGSKSSKFHTELTAYNELGEKLWEDHNELLIPGGLFTLAKISGVNMPIKTETLNTKLNLLASEDTPVHTGPRREDVIFGFVIGIGGCTDVFDTVKPVKYKEIEVDSLVPFRKPLKSDDISPDTQRKYALKVTNGNYYEYYVKKFESTPVIKAEYDEAGSPTVTNPATGPDTPINTYVQFTLKISKQDVREWFKINGGGLRKARVNTLGLVTGYPVGSEYKGVRAFSKINFNNEPFDNETKELTVIYKIYI